MTGVRDEAQFLWWLTSDGPVPANVGREVLKTQGFDWRNRWRLNRAKQEAQVVSRRNGYGPGAAYFWQGARDDTPLPETPDTWAQCTACGQVARFPRTQLPRPCLHIPRCHGQYQPRTEHTTEDTTHGVETHKPQTGVYQTVAWG